ncbi:Transforming Acidic Coiled-Coil-Containing Protein 3 [Manis pentadactyla]|nr:Transforming Acidic Coiled-Coil-Containing Protein 3 [Manis pentadactyla]
MAVQRGSALEKHSKSGESARPASPRSRPGSPHWEHLRAWPCQPSGGLQATKLRDPCFSAQKRRAMGESSGALHRRQTGCHTGRCPNGSLVGNRTARSPDDR